MRVFGKDFVALDEAHIQDLFTLEREQAIYTDHRIDELNDFRHVKIPFKPDEVAEFVRGAWANELFARAGYPKSAKKVKGIPEDIAERADSYTMHTKDGKTKRPWHCFAGFVGPKIEELICFTPKDRQILLDSVGIESVLATVRRAVDSLTPAIRAFNKRERGLTPWPVKREDDVRDLLYAMLRSSLSDLRREESIPTRGGVSTVVDLFSPAAQMLLEVKWIGSSGRWKRTLEEIHVDIQNYATHSSCRYLFFLIVDADRKITDPRQVESDLSGQQEVNGKRVEISVFVREP